MVTDYCSGAIAKLYTASAAAASESTKPMPGSLIDVGWGKEAWHVSTIRRRPAALIAAGRRRSDVSSGRGRNCHGDRVALVQRTMCQLSKSSPGKRKKHKHVFKSNWRTPFLVPYHN